MRTALVVMPFASPDRPSLAAGLLKSGLEREDVVCEVKYFNLVFCNMLGEKVYTPLAKSNMTALAGEWLFSQIYYGQQFSDWESYRSEVLDHPLWGMGEGMRDGVLRAAELAPEFLSGVLESEEWGKFDLVGFTSTFEQTFASLCLARSIRERNPQVRIAFGGANFEMGMGAPYIENFDFIDFVATGEADHSYPALCRSLKDVLAGEADAPEVPPGFLFRRDGEIVVSAPPEGVADLEDLATPNYDDFFRTARSLEPSGTVGPDNVANGFLMPVEASRGCWWGQKAHCTFCGLNGRTMAFRRKSWQRVVEEAEELKDRYGEAPLVYSDNILDVRYFEDLLPYWAANDGVVPKFFEIKANLRREQVGLMKNAGVRWIQPGIESLVNGTLRLMRKGVSAAQNVALLRWAHELGLRTFWNILYGFPKEGVEDCDRNLGVVRLLTHLQPPDGCGPIRLDRFSPNFVDWRDHGFTSISPMDAYRHLFPFDDASLHELAYYFRYEHPQFEEVVSRAAELHQFVRDWRSRSENGDNGELVVRAHEDGGFCLEDTRFSLDATTERLLTDSELAILLICDAPVSRAGALRRADTVWSSNWPAREPEEVLTELVRQAVIGEIGGQFVTLSLLPPQEEIESETIWRSGPPRAPARRAD